MLAMTVRFRNIFTLTRFSLVFAVHICKIILFTSANVISFGKYSNGLHNFFVRRRRRMGGECAVSLSSHGEFIHVYKRRVGGLVHANFSQITCQLNLCFIYERQRFSHRDKLIWDLCILFLISGYQKLYVPQSHSKKRILSPKIALGPLPN